MNSPFDVCTVFTLKGSQAGIQQLALRNNDEIEAGHDLMTTEHLTNEAFCSVAINRSPESLARGNSQSPDRELVFQNEHDGEAAVDLRPALVHSLEFRVPANVFVSPKARHKLLESELLFAAHRKALATFCAPTLEHQAAIFRAHAHEKPVRFASMPSVWLKCTLALHRSPEDQERDLKSSRPRRFTILEKTELLMLVNAFGRCQRRKVCVRVGVLRLLPI